MSGSFSNLAGIEIFFSACAVIGGIFVTIRMILQFIGADADSFDADVDAAGGDSDASFHVLSIQSLSAFFLMFGLVGLAMHRQSGASPGASILGGVIAGCLSVWLIGKLFTLVSQLQSSGTLDNSAALNNEGNVYMTIPEGGQGKVTIKFSGRLREFDAAAQDGQEIATGEPVRVIKVSGRTMIVERISKSA